MRFLFTCAAGESHFYNIVPFALAVRDRGHDVVFSTTGDLTAVVEAAGFGVAPSGSGRLRLRTAMARRAAAPDHLDDRGAELFGAVAPALKWERLVEVIRDVRPDAVVSELLDVAGPLAARVADIPVYTVSIGPFHPETVADLWTHARPLFQTVLGPRATARDLMGTYIDVCPPGLQTPEGLALPDRLWARVGTYHGADTGRAAVSFGGGKRPRVLVTFGTVSNAAIPGMAAAAERLAAAGFEVVVTLGPQGWFDTGRPKPGPHPAGAVAGRTAHERIRLVDYSPLQHELAVATVVVHHGGSNTMRAAIEAAVPSVLIPQGSEQLRNARWLSQHGLGSMLTPLQADPPAVSAAVERAADDPSTAWALRSARAAWLAMPDVAGAVQEMERRLEAGSGGVR